MIKTTLIPILNDNYAYLTEGDNGEIAILDPGVAAPIIKALEGRNLKPDIILITHHHWDHTDGIQDLLKWHNCAVAGPKAEATKIKFLTIELDENSDFSFANERVQIIETPGHTLGHICYYFPESAALFAGDTLFSMGCGRLFEGTPDDMWNSMQKLRALPDETTLYCGHEYTLSNAQFCLKHAPDNEALQKRTTEVKAIRVLNKPTLPITLKSEKQTNLFLNAQSPEEFAKIRKLKDEA